MAPEYYISLFLANNLHTSSVHCTRSALATVAAAAPKLYRMLRMEGGKGSAKVCLEYDQLQLKMLPSHIRHQCARQTGSHAARQPGSSFVIDSPSLRRESALLSSLLHHLFEDSHSVVHPNATAALSVFTGKLHQQL